MHTSYVGLLFQRLHCTLVGQSDERICVCSGLENGCIKRPWLVFLSSLSSGSTILKNTHKGFGLCLNRHY